MPTVRSISFKDCAFLRKILLKADQLETLDIQNTPLLSQASVESSTLTHVHMEGNLALSDQALDQLAATCPTLQTITCEGCTQVKRPDLRQNFPLVAQANRSADFLREVVDAISSYKAYNKHKTPTLDLTHRATTPNIIALSQVIPQNSSLTCLTIRKNNEEECYLFGDEEAVILGPALSRMHSLQRLNLSKNRIRDTGAIALFRGLRKHPSIRSVILRENRIGDPGAIAIGEALPFIPSLETLELAYNYEIGPHGAGTLSKGIQGHPALTYLALTGNRLGNQGIMALAKIFPEGSVL